MIGVLRKKFPTDMILKQKKRCEKSVILDRFMDSNGDILVQNIEGPMRIIVVKEKGIFCDFFQLAEIPFSNDPKGSQDEAKKRLEGLFKKK